MRTLHPVDLSIRVCDKDSVQYLPIPNARFTETQYNQVFVSELKDELEEPVPLTTWRRIRLTI